MFEPTWTLPNFTFGQLIMWIGANNDQIWLPIGYVSDSVQCSNRLELDLIMAPKGGHIVISVSVRLSIRPFVTDHFCWRVVVCVHFSSETTRPISPMMIPINWGNSVDVQRALHFDFDPSMTAGQGHEILWFWEFRCLTGSSLCTPPLRNYSTDFSNDDTNQLREQCRCATGTSFWPWPLHGCRSRSQNTLILWI